MAVCEKRSLEETVHNAKNVLLDIEGTTTSISFVQDTLFPYVRKGLESYVTANWDKDEFKEVLTLLREQATADVESKVSGAIAIPTEGSLDEQQAAVVSNVLWQMDLNRKTTALKKLQGLVWSLGYKDGELKGHVYPDVAPALRRWTESGRKLYVYSSGSVEAQKLLFKYSQEGDLSELFSGHFDTTVGSKLEADSYKAIVKSLDCKPDNVIFLTDVPKEASAAREAGLPVVLVTREDSQELTADEKGDFSSVSTLEDVVFEATASKKQKVDETKEVVKETEAEKMDVEEEKKTPKTEVAEKEDPKTEVAEKMEEEKKAVEKVEDVKETVETAPEKSTETKKASEKVEKVDDDSETKVEDKVAETPAKKVEAKESTEEVKPVEESTKVAEKSPETEKKEDEASSGKEEKVEKPEEKAEKKEAEKVSTTEEEVKPSKPVEVDDKKVEEKEAKAVEKIEEKKVEEKKAEVKVDVKTVDKAEEAVEDKSVENKEEKEKGVEAKEEETKDEKVSEDNVESKVPKQNGVENGQSVNGVSNGKAEKPDVNGKEANEVVVKKAAVGGAAEAEMAAEA